MSRTITMIQVAAVIGALVAETLPADGGSSDGREVGLPVPSKVSREAAAKRIKTAYRDQYAAAKGRSAAVVEAKVSLARRLLRDAKENRNDAASTYVLLDESRTLAIEAGNVELAVRALGALVGRFDCDSRGLTRKTFESLHKSARVPNERWLLGQEVLFAANALLANCEFSDARKLLVYAAKIASSGDDQDLVQRARRYRGRAKTLERRRKKASRWFEMLARDPADPTANLQVGRYRAFYQGDWESALPHLAKGSDRALRTLAKSELVASKDPVAWMEIGNGWRELAGKVSDKTTAPIVQAHALDWYERASPHLDPVTRATIESRIRDGCKPTASVLSVPSPSFVRGAAFGFYCAAPSVARQRKGASQRDRLDSSCNVTVHGAKVVPGKIGFALEFETGDYALVQGTQSLPVGTRSTIALWMRPREEIDETGTRWQTLVSKGRSGNWLAYALYFYPEDGCLTLSLGEQYAQTEKDSWKAGEWVHVAVTCSNAAVRIYVNGKLDGVTKLTGPAPKRQQPLLIGSLGVEYRNDIFGGAIDEVALWRRVLSAEEIEALYRYSLSGKSYAKAISRW